MDSLPFGLSVHHFVNSVGADAGFAALIAVAILVLLYFAQARETATLRARADEAGLKVEELEAQIADLTDQVAGLPAEISVRAASPRAAAAYGGSGAAVAAGVPAAGGSAAAVSGAAGGLLPAAPAGVAAPALADATRLIPDPDLPVTEPEPASQPAPTSALYGAHDVGTVGGPAPATAAGGANGSSHRPVAAPAATMPRPVAVPAGSGGARGGAGGAGAGGGQAGARTGGGAGRGGGGAVRQGGAGYGRPAGAGQARSGGSARPQGAPARPARRRSRGRIVLGVLVAALAAGAVFAAAIVLANRDRSSTASKSSARSAATTRRPTSLTGVRPSAVTVSVLNGTDVSGLGARVSQRLATDGYHAGAAKNASDQTQTTSVVSYMTPTDRADALAVASSLKLSPTTVQPVDANTRAIACPPNLACTSAVVVTIGRDLASQ
jgi:LytR cell envelope-related transcriptional attenuator